MTCACRQSNRSLGLRPDAGLAEVLTGQASVEDAILRVEGTELDVLPVRGIPSNPAELPRLRKNV